MADPPCLVEFEGPCPFATCLETGAHAHPRCPSCGAVRFGKLSCRRCRAEQAPGGWRWAEMQTYFQTMRSARKKG